MIAGNLLASKFKQSHNSTPQAKFELASTVQYGTEKDTEFGDIRTDESTGDGVRCDVLKRCSFRSVSESVGIGKGVPITIGVRQRANDFDQDVVEYLKDWLECK